MIKQNKEKFTQEHLQLLLNTYYKFGQRTEDAEFLIHLYYFTFPATFHQHWKNMLDAAEQDKTVPESVKITFVLKYCSLLLSKTSFCTSINVPQVTILEPASLDKLVKLSLQTNDVKNILLVMYIMQELLLAQASLATSLLANLETIANSSVCKIWDSWKNQEN